MIETVYPLYGENQLKKIFKFAQIYDGSNPILITSVTYLLFGWLYLAIYKITSAVYYKIVSQIEKD